MSLDPRSRERLEALGRQLPRKLPPPSAPGAGGSTADADAAAPATSTRRHRVETEQDPRQLFRELMQVSPDGTVPPHLLERLRRLETSRRTSRAAQEKTETSVSEPAPAAGTGRTSGRRRGRGEASPSRDQGEWDLYDEFLQRLEEEEEASG